MPHQLAPPLASTAKTAPFQPVAPCPSFSKYPRKSHSAFKPETQRPRLFDRGDTPLPGGLLYVQHWYTCSIERLFARMFVRLTCCVSCGIARARSFVCDHGRACRGRPSCRGCVRRAVASLGVAVVTWPWRPWVWPWRAVAVAVASAVFVSPSCGCDTPMDASVCNGFSGVCVVSICLTFARRV